MHDNKNGYEWQSNTVCKWIEPNRIWFPQVTDNTSKPMKLPISPLVLRFKGFSVDTVEKFEWEDQDGCQIYNLLRSKYALTGAKLFLTRYT